MASLFKDPSKLSVYRDRRFPGTQEEFEQALLTSTTVYLGNMSFYTTEEQVYELFSRAGEIKKIIMGLDKNSKTPCGFCFVLYYSREDTEDAVKYISGTILDDRPIRVDFDWGFQEGRQWGRGRSGGQVRDEYRTDYDPGRGGYGKLVQRELEAQRQLVDYGTGSLGTFPPVMPQHYSRHGGSHGHGGYHRHGRDYHRKRYRDDDHHYESSKRHADHESRKNSDHDSRPVISDDSSGFISSSLLFSFIYFSAYYSSCFKELFAYVKFDLVQQEKNPRFRESGDSDDEEEDERKRRS